jgi:glycosyltransferase involved in cell wall biosynthesis
MKIAIVYDQIYPWSKGGVEKRIYEISKRLYNRGHEVHLFGIKSWNGEDVFSKEGIIYHGLICGEPTFNRRRRRSIKLPICFAKKLLENITNEFDVIEVESFPYLPFFAVLFKLKFRRRTLVVTWHEVWGTYWFEYLGRFVGIFGFMLEKAMIMLSKHNISNSSHTKNKIQSYRTREVAVIPSGINGREIEAAKKLDREYDIVYAGRLSKEKGVDLLIDSVYAAIRSGLNVKVCIIGDGPEKKKLADQVIKLGISKNINFLPYIEDSIELYSIFKSSRLFVSCSFREGLGLTVLEALSIGIPVIVTNSRLNASQSLVKNGLNGYVCESTIESVSHAIVSVLSNYEFFRFNNTKYIVDFDWEKITDDLEKFYRGLKEECF